jgi:hypothetical protein
VSNRRRLAGQSAPHGASRTDDAAARLHRELQSLLYNLRRSAAAMPAGERTALRTRADLLEGRLRALGHDPSAAPPAVGPPPAS